MLPMHSDSHYVLNVYKVLSSKNIRDYETHCNYLSEQKPKGQENSWLAWKYTDIWDLIQHYCCHGELMLYLHFYFNTESYNHKKRTEWNGLLRPDKQTLDRYGKGFWADIMKPPISNNRVMAECRRKWLSLISSWRTCDVYWERQTWQTGPTEPVSSANS